MTKRLYVDASALVKLCVDEHESLELESFLADEPILLASSLVTVEVERAARRAGGERAVTSARAVCSTLVLIAPSMAIRTTARTVAPAGLRTLDAIHVATAVSAGAGVWAAIVYDHRLQAAMSDAGLTVIAPGS